MTYCVKHDKLELLKNLLRATDKTTKLNNKKTEKFFTAVKKQVVSVSSRIIFIMRSTWKKGYINYKALFQKSKNRSELVATFLAVLELILNKRVYIEEKKEDLIIKLNKNRKDKI